MIDSTHKKLHDRLIDICQKKSLSHISSCVTTLPVLVSIYGQKKPDDIVILSNGHAGLAQYVCMEHYEGKNAEDLYDKFGTHPERSPEDGIFCSTGSLGFGLPIAIGAALADKGRKVWCVVSDGECCEGSIWESLYFMTKRRIENLSVHVNVNGYSAYDKVDISKLDAIIGSFSLENVTVHDTSGMFSENGFLRQKGMESHYSKITNDTELKLLKHEI